MKLAILLAGQPRQIGVGYTSLKKFYLDKYDCDVFCHTWFDDPFPVKVYGDLITLFNPKNIMIEKQVIFDKTGRTDPNWGTTLQNLSSMWYSIGMAYYLCELYQQSTGIEYDYVMRTRTDLQINKPIELEKIEAGKLALYNWTMTGYNQKGLSDVFAIGSPQVMQTYVDLFNDIEYYIDEDQSYVIDDSKMRPEYVLKHHIVTAHNVPVQVFPHNDVSDPSFNIVR